MAKPFNSKSSAVTVASSLFSRDTWAVLLSLLFAALIRFGVIKSIPW